jgi:predicted transcriptional regulator of viral defense system
MKVIIQETNLSKCIEKIQANGRYYFTLHELIENFNGSKIALQQQLKRQMVNKKIALIKKGFYVIVTPEYRKVGCPPISFFIHGLMQWLEKPYYIGLLNAAAWYGATQQQPQGNIIITSPPNIKSINKSHLAINFLSHKNWNETFIENIKTSNGYLKMSSIELTCLDMCYYQKQSGGINNIVQVIEELSEKVDIEKLLLVTKNYTSLMAVQRLGYILDFTKKQGIANDLYNWFKSKKSYPTLLDIQQTDIKNKVTGNRWKVITNTAIELDL